jgi:hypothetical protein
MLPAHRFYYLYNFERALLWIEERSADLLCDQERQFLMQFAQLPLHSRALMVRMLMRRGPCFRASKLRYEEIPDVEAAAAPLLELGWLESASDLALEELFALHTKAELLHLFAHLCLNSSLRKAEMLEAVGSACAQNLHHAAWPCRLPDTIWRVAIKGLCERLRLVFFGNLHQDWSAFVLADLGILKYECVALDADSRAFQSRADVDCYLALQACRQALDDSTDPGALLVDLQQCNSANFWINQRRAKILLRVGQACERSHDWSQAAQAYAMSGYPGARHRLMRVYERSGRFAQALALALEAQAQPENDEERQRVARMLPRLERRLKLCGSRPEVARSSPAAAQCMHVELDPHTGQQGVEWALRDHWHTDEAPVFYVENALINSLFGLLCWPAVFAALPGAFFHPFQSGPADLHLPDFAVRRAAIFEQCLACIEDGTYRDVIRQRYFEKRDIQCPLVFWNVLTDKLLDLALGCIPAEHLRWFCLRLLGDVQANRTGLPDLVRFWPREGRYEFIEVKAPGDKLQDNQVRWMNYFSEHGIPARVCHVTWRQAPLATACAQR